MLACYFLCLFLPNPFRLPIVTCCPTLFFALFPPLFRDLFINRRHAANTNAIPISSIVKPNQGNLEMMATPAIALKLINRICEYQWQLCVPTNLFHMRFLRSPLPTDYLVFRITTIFSLLHPTEVALESSFSIIKPTDQFILLVHFTPSR